MRPINKAGFTIIETMLFLGISGLLAMGIFIGIGSSVNNQRYRDSVISLQSILQQQYSEVANVRNQSSSNDCVGTTNKNRGQSDCVVLGKYITSSPDGKSLTIYSVIGMIPSVEPSLNDIVAIGAYNIRVSDFNKETYNIEYASSINKKNGSGIGMTLSMLIVRSPLSGVIRTFVADTVLPVDKIVESGALEKDATLCVDSNGLLDPAVVKMAVYIEKNVTSAYGIKIKGDDSGC
jgi:type II secretory pathway pseudopilin PulG